MKGHVRSTHVGQRRSTSAEKKKAEPSDCALPHLAEAPKVGDLLGGLAVSTSLAVGRSGPRALDSEARRFNIDYEDRSH